MGSSHSSETAGDASYSPSGSPRTSHEEARTVLEEERVNRKKWNQSELKTAWRKNDIMTGHEDDPDIRRDQFGHEIHREDFGKRGDHGWEVDHQRCRKHGGGNDHDNLRAMHHANNNWKRDKDADQFEYTDGGRHFRRD